MLNGEIGRVLSCSLRVAEHAKGTVTVKGEAYILEKVVHGDFTQVTKNNFAATLKKIVYPDAEDQTPIGNIARAYRKLAEDIEKDTRQMPDFNDAVKHELLDAIRESSRTGKRVRLNTD